jgi:tetratricopeptide (TPR) repeat protein
MNSRFLRDLLPFLRRYARPLAVAWASAGVIATIGGVLGLLVLFGVCVPFTRDPGNDASIGRLEEKVDRLPEYLADLDKAQKATLRAAYQEARFLQLEGYEAQDAEKHREAIDRFSRALPLAETDAQRAALYILRGNSYFSISGFEAARRDFDTALRSAEMITDSVDQAEATSNALAGLGMAHSELGNLDQAQGYLTQALTLDKATAERADEAADLMMLGIIYLRMGDTEQAEVQHKQALAIYHDIGNRLGEASNLLNLGIVYAESGNLEKAQEAYNRALLLHRDLGNRLGEAADLSNLGILHSRTGDLKAGESYLRQALAIHEDIGSRSGQAADLNNLALIYKQRGELKKAQGVFEQALSIHIQTGSVLGEADSLANLGVLALEGGKQGDGCRRLEEAAAIYEGVGARGPDLATVRAAMQEFSCE